MPDITDKHWTDMTEAELADNPEKRKIKTMAFYNTFFGTDDGRDVMTCLRKIVYDAAGMEPLAVLARIELLEYIRINCGLTDAGDLTNAEADACKL